MVMSFANREVSAGSVRRAKTFSMPELTRCQCVSSSSLAQSSSITAATPILFADYCGRASGGLSCSRFAPATNRTTAKTKGYCFAGPREIVDGASSD